MNRDTPDGMEKIMTIRVDKETHQAIKELAKINDRNMQQTVRLALKLYVAKNREIIEAHNY